MLEGANVLVTGGSGFLGGHLVRRLHGLGARVRTTYLSRPVAAEGVEAMRADLTLKEDCARAVAGMDYVFMCAAVTSGAAVITSSPLTHVTPNVVMNALTMDAAYEAGVRKFVFISSGAAYPETGDRPVHEDEMFSAEPYDGYYAAAWMKRYAETLCRVYAEKIKRPMATLVVRPSNVYGPGDKFDFQRSHVTAALIRRVVERQQPLTVWGTGNDVRDLLYIDDFIDGLIAAFSCERPHLAINICAGQGHTVRQILETALRVDGYENAEVIFDPSKPSTIPVRLMSNQMARELLDFEARIDLEEGIRRTISWYNLNK